jgi:hypothetical protein
MAKAVECSSDIAQNRLTQVFKFLKALNELRNPVPRDLSGYSQILWIRYAKQWNAAHLVRLELEIRCSLQLSYGRCFTKALFSGLIN